MPSPRQGYLSWWNDNISYVLRGTILIELSLRGRIDTTKDSRRRPYPERTIEVINKTVRLFCVGRPAPNPPNTPPQPTGDVILDEALKLIHSDKQSVVSWMDFLSGT